MEKITEESSLIRRMQFPLVANKSNGRSTQNKVYGKMPGTVVTKCHDRINMQVDQSNLKMRKYC